MARGAFFSIAFLACHPTFPCVQLDSSGDLNYPNFDESARILTTIYIYIHNKYNETKGVFWLVYIVIHSNSLELGTNFVMVQPVTTTPLRLQTRNEDQDFEGGDSFRRPRT